MRRRAQLAVEALEDRALPAHTVLVIDFTPDAKTEQLLPKPFKDVFKGPSYLHLTAQERYIYAPQLDGNGDRKLTDRDVVIMANRLGRETRERLAPYGIEVIWGDVLKNRNLGQQWLAKGQADPNLLVMVTYVADKSVAGFWGVLGESFQAPVGFNLEWYNYCYFGVQSDAWSGPKVLFRHAFVGVIIHEAGHMMGLGHPVTFDKPSNVMTAAQAAQYWVADYFPQPQIVELWDAATEEPYLGEQNAVDEVFASVTGQPDFHTDGLIYYQRQDNLFPTEPQ